MNITAYLLGILLQAVAGVIALWQVRRAPRWLPWLLIAISSLLIVARRAAAMSQAVSGGKGLAMPELITLVISVLFFLGVLLMSRMFREIEAGQEARKKSEALLRTAGRVARFGGWSANLEDGQVAWSDEVAIIHDKEPGFSPSVDEGIQFYAPEWRAQIAEAFDACARNGTPYDQEMEIVTARGRHIWVRTSGEAVRDPAGSIIRVQGAFQDISQQKVAEAAARERQRVYDTLLANLPGFVYRCGNDRDWTMKFVSSGCYAITGYHPEDLLDNRTIAYNELLLPEYREPLWQQWQQLLATQSPFEAEYRIRSAEGEVRWVWERGRGEFDESGKLLYLEGYIEDITGRKRAEELLKRALEKLSLAQQSAGAGVWDWDMDTEKIEWSPELFRLFGLDPAVASATFETWRNVLHPEDREAAEGQLRDAIRNHHRLENEYRIIVPPGETRWIDARGDATYDETGHPVRMTGICLDITGRKTMEMQFLQSQKMEAIGQLAGGVAHDFRNQLQVIMGFAEMLLRRGLVKDEGRPMVEMILKATERSSKTTGQLLAFGRRETLHAHVQSIRNSIADIRNVLPQMLGEDVRLVFRFSSEDDQVNIDSHLLQQAIVNLATNARDAMPEGGELVIETARVTLGAESRKIDPDLAEGPYVVVSVSDTGSGMDRATLAKVFDPFFTTKDVGKGTGLGLPMVYGFVKQSGGGVAVQSKPGQGATVRLYFPRIVSAPADGASKQGTAVLRRGSETILLVEDEPAVLSMMSSLLREAGYRVLTGASAEAALSLVERYDGVIDMLVTDIVMPGKSGMALAGPLKARYPGLGVLCVSGYPGVELAKRGIDESAETLAKPFTGEHLLEKVREILDGRKAEWTRERR